MDALSLDFYGARVRLESADAATLEQLRRDFEYFVDEPGAAALPGISWTLERRAPRAGELPSGLPALAVPGRFTAWDSPRVRVVRYADGPAAVYDYGARRGRLYAEDAARLRELAYLAVLSRAGEALDERGLHRVHALGLESAGRGALVLLPSGGGKSVLALALLRAGTASLASDDSPLVCRRCLRLHAFPLRLGFLEDADLSCVPAERVRPFARRGFAPKRLVDLGFFRARVSTGAPVSCLFLGRRGAAPKIEPASRAAALAALADALVVGRGLAQMSEYTLRPTPATAARLARIALSRAAAAWGLAASARCYALTLGPDADANARALEAFLAAAPAAALT